MGKLWDRASLYFLDDSKMLTEICVNPICPVLKVYYRLCIVGNEISPFCSVVEFLCRV